ncbi:hypothetical protein CASFOL_015798 [Castilleja foliolosa]|uniref:Uncharacterized protein n=1 Tax=Castilleja foliolosa TaxID=1961234 RepID=A0ABD3DEQ9_9LAMI
MNCICCLDVAPYLRNSKSNLIVAALICSRQPCMQKKS